MGYQYSSRIMVDYGVKISSRRRLIGDYDVYCVIEGCLIRVWMLSY